MCKLAIAAFVSMLLAQPLLAGSTPQELNELLRHPISRQHGIGAAHETVTGSPRAQAYYDQGLALLYSYDWIRAAQSFNAALIEDPKLAMAYVGLSFAYGGIGDLMGADEAKSRAQQQAANASRREQTRIELRRIQLDAIFHQNDSSTLRRYRDALDHALQQYPNDVTLLLLRGNAAEESAAGIGQKGTALSISYYDRVLALYPDNFAAHHFLIHSNEMIGNISEALRNARAYVRLAPGVAHAHHMLGHDLRRTGRVAQAIAEFRKAAIITTRHAKSSASSLRYDWHYRHNLALLGLTYQQADQINQAKDTFTVLRTLPGGFPDDCVYQQYLPLLMLQEERYDGSIASAKALTSSEFAPCRVLGHSIIGNAEMMQGHFEAAVYQLKWADKEASPLGAEWYAVVAPWMEVLRGQILLRGHNRQGTSHLENLEWAMQHAPGSDAWSQAMMIMMFVTQIAVREHDSSLLKTTVFLMQQHCPQCLATSVATDELIAGGSLCRSAPR